MSVSKLYPRNLSFFQSDDYLIVIEMGIIRRENFFAGIFIFSSFFKIKIKNGYLIHTLTDKAYKGTVINRAWPARGLPETKLIR